MNAWGCKKVAEYTGLLGQECLTFTLTTCSNEECGQSICERWGCNKRIKLNLIEGTIN